MAVYKIFPTKDTSLYSEYPEMNTGIDAILEASTYMHLGNPYISRYLIQFSTTEIQNILNNTISGANFLTNLKNSAAVVTGVHLDSQLEVYRVSGSWDMGTGHFGDSPNTTNGASWTYRESSGSAMWSVSGGDYYNTQIYSQSFSCSNPIDLEIDVTPTILSWYSGSSINDGFLIKQPSSVENNTSINLTSIFKYFSIDTNTIYPPCLEFKWVDYVFNTGSSTNTILGTPQSLVSIYNNRGTYYSGSIARMRFAAIPKYPVRTFITSSQYNQNYYLPPTTSLYAIKDSSTNEYVVTFDPIYTRISSDTTSSYFDINMGGLEPERYYTILVKTVIGGNTQIFDENMIFKVSN